MSACSAAATKREAFLAERRTGIGGSDMADLFSLEPYGCARRLAYDKTGIDMDNPPDERQQRQFSRGIHGEALAVAEYVRQTARKTRKMAVRRHPAYAHFLVHADRQILATDDRGTGALEVKCPSTFMFRKIAREGMPDAYTLQGQWELYVTGYQWGSFAVFSLDGWDLRWFDFLRDHALINRCADAAGAFWKTIKSGLLPERLPADDARCGRCAYKRTCQGEAMLVQIAKGQTVQPIRDQNVFLDGLADDYLDAVEMEKEAKEIKEAAAGRLRSYLGGQKAVDTGKHRVYWTTYARKEYVVKATQVTSLRVFEV